MEVAEYTENKMVKSIEFFNKRTEYVEMIITTLEDHKIYVECSSQGGIRVKN